MTYREFHFDSAGVRCAARHFEGQGTRFDTERGRPVVVMAHGFGGTMDSGLQPFAENFAAAGLDVVTFDYRGFGQSEGTPRQHICISDQLADYHCAIGAAGRLPDVEPSRIVLWGPSLSGGHVLRVAAERTDIAAVIAMTPLTSAVAASRSALTEGNLGAVLRGTARGLRSSLQGRRGRTPLTMPIVAAPGEVGALTLEGARESYLSIAGPSWRNEIDAAVGMELAKIQVNKYVGRLDIPVLVQIADDDRFVPATSTMATAVAARARVHHYPCDHFDVWPGHDWFAKASEDQIRFLSTTLVTADREVAR